MLFPIFKDILTHTTSSRRSSRQLPFKERQLIEFLYCKKVPVSRSGYIIPLKDKSQNSVAYSDQSIRTPLWSRLPSYIQVHYLGQRPGDLGVAAICTSYRTERTSPIPYYVHPYCSSIAGLSPIPDRTPKDGQEKAIWRVRDALCRHELPESYAMTLMMAQLDQVFLDKIKSKLQAAGGDDPILNMDEAAYFDYILSGCVDEESFRQEYMCEPSDDASAFISYDLLDACTMAHAEKWELPLDPQKTYHMGVDIGRTHDLTVLYLLEVDGKNRYTRRIVELKNTPFMEQAAAIDRYACLPHVRRVCIDATGIGRQLAEDARNRHDGKVEEVIFTAGVKEDLAVTLRRAMEDAALKIPPLPALAADLRSIRKETTSAGNVRYVGERTTNGHADRFWALALALHAGKTAAMPSMSRWATFGGRGSRERYHGARH